MTDKVKIFYYGIRRWVLICFAILFSPFLFALTRNRRRAAIDASRILVIPQITRIGDLVCTTPVFRAIKEKYPKSHLAVLVTNRIAGIVRANPHVDELITFKSIDFASRVLSLVREKHFDWCFAMEPSAIGTLVALFGLIPNRVKLTRRPRPPSEFLTDWLMTDTFRYEHHTYLPAYYVRMLKFIGIALHPANSIRGEVFTTPEGEKKAGEFLKERGVAPDDLLVGISITAGNKIKEWGDEKFAEVVKYLIDRYRAKVAVIGSGKDSERIDSFLRRFNTNLQIIANSRIANPRIFKAVEFSLEELPSFMKRLKLFIAVDTGPIYIAHALKVPLIDIIGPVDPREQPPKDVISIQVLPEGNIESSSFVMKGAGIDFNHQRSLRATKVEAVTETIDHLFGAAIRG